MLQRKFAHVTGFTCGIGPSVANALAEAGLRVMLDRFGTANLISDTAASMGGVAWPLDGDRTAC